MIKIICVGHLKEKYLKEAETEYLKRLTKYNKLELLELDDKGYNDTSKVIKEEGKEILKHLDDKSFIITLEINGKEFDSISFAKKIEEINISYPNITFIIGGSYGLSSEVIEKANMHMSFSHMTFPHQLFRIMLLEQIYRAYKIINNESYHK